MPTWLHKLNVADVFHNDDLTLAEKRDAICWRIKRSSWAHNDMDLLCLVDQLEESDTVEEFDSAWNDLYDWFDDARVWVITRQAPPVRDSVQNGEELSEIASR